MTKILAVAWREFKHTALTKAFIIGTIIFPLLIWGGMILVPLLFKPTISTVDDTLAIVDPTGEVIDAARIEFNPDLFRLPDTRERAAQAQDMDPSELLAEAERGGGLVGSVQLNIEIEPHESDDDVEILRNRVREGDLIGVVVITDNAFDGTARDGVTLFVATQANPDHISAIQRTLGKAVVRARAERAELDVEHMQAMMQPPRLNTRRLTEDGEAAAGIEFQKALPMVFMILLWICAFASGNYLLTSTIEEKSNKVMEVLLSAISPMQLMAGKIFGQAIVGLFTISVYSALGVAALVYFAMADFIEPAMILYLVMYFFMAYFMVAAIMAAIGSAVSDLQEAHSLVTPAMLVLFVPMILFVPVSQSPNGILAVVTSYIPVLTPFVMILRVTSAEAIPLIQILTATAVGFLGVFIMVWMAARIFRIGVLMTGKPPSPMELLKWLRYS